MTEYLVIGLNNDEFGRGIDRPVHRFNSENELRVWLLTSHTDLSRLEIYRVTPLTATLAIEEKF